MEIGELCTRCGTKLTLLGTTNPWQFYCRTCDERYQSVDCKQSLREHQAAEEWVRAFDRS